MTILILFVLLCLMWLGIGYWLSSRLLYARRQPLTRSPAQMGLDYEEVSFPSQDRLRLKGWWIPAKDAAYSEVHAPVVVLLHPFFGNRHGLSIQHKGWPRLVESDVNLLKIAQAFHGAGYALLLFDFRSHGESQRGLCAGGLTEDQDVMGAVDYVFQRVKAKAPGTDPAVGVVGFGLGASAALAAVGREKGGAEVIHVFSGDSAGGSGFVEIQPLTVKRLRFLVAVQPASQGALLRGYLRQTVGLAGCIFVPVVDHLCRRRGGFPLAITTLLKFVCEVHIPVLYVQGTSERRGDEEEIERIYDCTPGEKQIWRLEETRGPLATYQYLIEHPERLLAFAQSMMYGGLEGRDAAKMAAIPARDRRHLGGSAGNN